MVGGLTFVVEVDGEGVVVDVIVGEGVVVVDDGSGMVTTIVDGLIDG